MQKKTGPPPGFHPARGPCLAAPHVGPVGPARIPGLPPLDHRGGSRLRLATDARGAAAHTPATSLPGARRGPARCPDASRRPSRSRPGWARRYAADVRL
jgi:hypothetical protein